MVEVWVDENMGEQDGLKCVEHLKRGNVEIRTVVWVAKETPGAPDSAILDALKDRSAVLLTKDRVFHNTTLSEGLKSYCLLDDGGLTGKPLRNIPTKPALPGRGSLAPSVRASDAVLACRELVLDPANEKKLKKNRTRRRRIRNKVGGVQNIEEIAVTVTIYNDLIGISAQVSTNCGVKAFRASEAYVRCNRKNIAEVAVIECLALLLMIHAEEWSVKIYFDANTAMKDATHLQTPLVQKLASAFTQLQWVRSTKGRHLELLRRTAGQQWQQPTNMIVPSEYEQYLKRFSEM